MFALIAGRLDDLGRSVLDRISVLLQESIREAVAFETARREVVNLEDQGDQAGYYFGRPPDWILSCAELVDIADRMIARRTVVLDIVLPEPRAAVGRAGRELLYYCVPLTSLSKELSMSSVVLTDGRGERMPVLADEESARVTELGLARCLEDALDDGDLPSAIRDGLRELVTARGEQARRARDLIEQTVRANPEMGLLDEWGHVRGWVEGLVDQLPVWVVLRGLPGDRFTMTLTFDSRVGPLKILDRGELVEPRRELCAGHAIVRSVVVKRRVRFRTTVRNIRHWILTNLGWRPSVIRVPDPCTRNVTAYRMHVMVPEGVKTVDICNGAELEPVAVSAEAVDSQDETRFHGMRVSRYGPVDISIRIVHRGLLNLSLSVALAIVAVLWATQSAIERIDDDTERQLAGALLLLVPAFLTSFAVRPSEGVLATRLLAGVRAIIFLMGLLTAAAACTFAEIQPHIHQSAMLIWYGALATALAVLLLVGWIINMPWIEGQFKVRLTALRQIRCPEPLHLAIILVLLGGLTALAHAELTMPIVATYPRRAMVVFLVLVGVAAFASQLRYHDDLHAPTAYARDVLTVAATAGFVTTILVISLKADPSILDREVAWNIGRVFFGVLLLIGVFCRVFGRSIERRAEARGRARYESATAALLKES